ncbi:MAG TPA: DUF6441 family protein [Terricaulis sp.]|nr:DUF6441 family protein [Terricaulis sp.]
MGGYLTAMSRPGRLTGEHAFVLDVKTFGAWAKIADGERDLFLASQWNALKEEGDKIKEVARDNVRKAPIRGARRMATSWRGVIFPKKAPPYSSKPGYVLGTNAEMPLFHLEDGITITARGAGLMIPIGEAAKFKQPPFTERSGRLARVIAAMQAKYGKLSWFKARNGQLYYGAFKTTRSGGQQRFVPLFMVRKSVTIPKKLDTRAAIARASQGFEQRVAERTMQRFSAGHDAVVERATAATQ